MALRQHIELVRIQHQLDLVHGAGHVEMPEALERKYLAGSRESPWQWGFPATRLYVHRPTGQRRRHYLHETVRQRVVRGAARRVGLPKKVGCHTLRHSFATHLLEDGYDVRTIQALLGDSDVRATMVSTHVMQRGALGVRSPADASQAQRRRRQ